MPLLSKFSGDVDLKILTYNCYELAHTWQPSCAKTWWEIVHVASAYSLKLYALFYLSSTLMRQPKLNDVNLRRLILDILRSSAFLATNATAFIALHCLVRRMLSFYVIPSTGFLPGFLASLLAILIEQKKRRGVLAIYLSQLASEILFNMCVHRGYCRPIRHGEVLIFALAMAGFFSLAKRKKLDEASSSILNMIFDLTPAKPDALPFPLSAMPDILRNYLQKLRTHRQIDPFCKDAHPGSCLAFTAEGFLRNALVAYGGSVSLSLAMGLAKAIAQRNVTKFLLRSFFNKSSLQLALFLGCLPGFHCASGCLLRALVSRTSCADLKRLLPDLCGSSLLFPLVQGFAAGLALGFYKSRSIALYTLWKLIEVLYMNEAKRGNLPRWRYGDALLYSLAMAFILHSAIMQPHTIRPGYWNFLLGLTGGRFSSINWKMLDQFGYQSSLLYASLPRPKLNPLCTTMNPSLL